VISTLEAWVGGVLGGLLVVGYLAFVAVDAFRRARVTFDDILAEVGDAPAKHPERAA